MKIKELNPAKKYKFKKTLMTEEIDKAIPCPIEDPRNPYHNDYLKLKELSDGHLKEASQIYENEPNSDLVGTKFSPEFYRPVDHRIHTQNQPIYIKDNENYHPKYPSNSPQQKVCIAPVYTAQKPPQSVRTNHKQNEPNTSQYPVLKKTTDHQSTRPESNAQPQISSRAFNNNETFAQMTPANTPFDYEGYDDQMINQKLYTSPKINPSLNTQKLKPFQNFHGETTGIKYVF